MHAATNIAGFTLVCGKTLGKHYNEPNAVTGPKTKERCSQHERTPTPCALLGPDPTRLALPKIAVHSQSSYGAPRVRADCGQFPIAAISLPFCPICQASMGQRGVAATSYGRIYRHWTPFFACLSVVLFSITKSPKASRDPKSVENSSERRRASAKERANPVKSRPGQPESKRKLVRGEINEKQQGTTTGASANGSKKKKKEKKAPNSTDPIPPIPGFFRDPKTRGDFCSPANERKTKTGKETEDGRQKTRPRLRSFESPLYNNNNTASPSRNLQVAARRRSV